MEFGVDELAVEAGDVAQRNALGTFSGAGTGVGAVAEAEFVHFGHHCAGATFAFYLALGQEGELAYFGGYEEHRGAVFTSGNASTATDASGGVHGYVGYFL